MSVNDAVSSIVGGKGIQEKFSVKHVLTPLKFNNYFVIKRLRCYLNFRRDYSTC